MKTKTKTNEAPREHKKPWQETYATPEEIKAMLDSRVSLRYNEVRGRPEIHWLSAGPVIGADEQGFRYWFDRPEIEQLQRHNEAYETVHSELELVDLHFRKPVGREPRQLVSATMALQMIGGSLAYTLSKEEIGRAFAKLGFEYKRTAAQRGYIAIHRNGVEMEAYRRKLAEGETMTDDSMTPVW